jgi:site-specific recombinase
MQERKSTFSLLFFIKRKKLLKNGDAPVYMRVTVDGRFLEAALKRGIKPNLWNEKKQRSNGRDRLSLELNDFLDDTQTRILRIHQRFIDERKEINPKTILDEFAGRMERPKMLREIFKAENEKYRQRLEIGDSVLNTVLRAERTERYVGDFIKKQYKADDLPLSAIDNAFV